MPDQSQPRTVFVSHVHADNDVCDRYVAALRERGLDVWYDRTNMQAGRFLSTEIEAELERRTGFVVLLSPTSVRSYWVRSETDAYRSLAAHDASRLMLWVKIAPCDVPLLMRGIMGIDATSQPFDAAVAESAAALGAAPLVPPSHIQLSGAPTAAPTQAQTLDAPARDEPEIWRALLPWDVPLGRPSREEDGEPMLLAEALTMSVIRTAYTRRERDEGHPEPRVIAIARVPGGQWQVWEWRLYGNRIDASRWSMPSLAAAEHYVNVTLSARRGKMWWPAHGPLRVAFAAGEYGATQAGDVLDTTGRKAT